MTSAHRSLEREHAMFVRLAGEVPTPKDWARLASQRSVIEGMDEDDVRSAIKTYRSWKDSDIKVRDQTAVLTTIVTDARYSALAEIFADQANEDPTIQEWRTTHLGDRLLMASEVAEWIDRQREGSEPNEVLVTRIHRDGKLLPVNVYCGVERIKLEYVDPEGETRFVQVSWTGPLGRLAYLTKSLAKEYLWSTAEATNFVLTGQAPVVVPLRAKVSLGPGALGYTRVHIEADPRIPASRIAKAYKDLLSDPVVTSLIGNTTARAIDRKTADMAVCRYRHWGEPWSQICRRWNRDHLDMLYRDDWSFARDCNHAWRRVMGPYPSAPAMPERSQEPQDGE